MKITPVTNYSRPKYAITMAALLAGVATVSGCIETRTAGAVETREEQRTEWGGEGGAGYKPETGAESELDGDIAPIEETTNGYENIELAGTAEIWEETEEANACVTTNAQIMGTVTTDATARPGDAQIIGTVTTTEEYEVAELAGDVEFTEETTGDYDDTELAGAAEIWEEPDPDREYLSENFVAVEKCFKTVGLHGVTYYDPELDLDIGGTLVGAMCYLVCDENNDDVFYFGFVHDGDTELLSALESSEDAVEFKYGYITPAKLGRSDVFVIFVTVHDREPMSESDAELIFDSLTDKGFFAVDVEEALPDPDELHLSGVVAAPVS